MVCVCKVGYKVVGLSQAGQGGARDVVGWDRAGQGQGCGRVG